MYCVDPTNDGDVSRELDIGPKKRKPNPNSVVVWYTPPTAPPTPRGSRSGRRRSATYSRHHVPGEWAERQTRSAVGEVEGGVAGGVPRFGIPGVKPERVIKVPSAEDDVERPVYLCTLPMTNEKPGKR